MLEEMLLRRMREAMRCRDFRDRLNANADALHEGMRALYAPLRDCWLRGTEEFLPEVHRIVFPSEADEAWTAKARAALATGEPRAVWLRRAMAECGKPCPDGEFLRELECLESRLPLASRTWLLRRADNADFTLRVYRRLLGRDGSPAERAGWNRKLRIPFLGRRRVIGILENSGERRALLAPPAAAEQRKKILIATAYTPFADEPDLAGPLGEALKRRGDSIDILRLPTPAGKEQLLAWRMLDLEHSSGHRIDRLIALGSPAEILRHSAKTVWMTGERPAGAAPPTDARATHTLPVPALEDRPGWDRVAEVLAR